MKSNTLKYILKSGVTLERSVNDAFGLYTSNIDRCRRTDLICNIRSYSFFSVFVKFLPISKILFQFYKLTNLKKNSGSSLYALV